MHHHAKESVISEDISKFYEKYDGPTKHTEEAKKYLLTNSCLNFKQLYALYEVDLESNEKGNYALYIRCFRKLLPIFEGLHNLYSNTFWNLNDLQLEWVGSNYQYLLQSLQYEEAAICRTMEKCLLMTSILENALANVYFTISGKCTPPHLLRDLLRTEELYKTFGKEIVSLLIILVGTPLSTNLRNIVWHGFPRPQEIPDYYTSILVLVTHSLGCELRKNNIIPLFERPRVTDFCQSCEKVSKRFLLHPKWFDEKKCVEKLESPNWLRDGYKIYWYRIFHYFQTHQYTKLVILIIPQIELLLRLIYAQVNDFDITAKLDEYYITMDSFFECEVPNVEEKCTNNLLNNIIVNESLMKCVYDLFIAPNGPRLRDKISHGEADLKAIDNILLCDILLCLSMGLLSYESSFYNYESVFHLNCQAKEALCMAAEELQKLMETHLKDDTAGNFQPMSKLKTFPKIKIFHRHKKESEFMLLILNNANLLRTTSRNYDNSINTKLKLLAQRELHSKRRRTLERMLTTLPLICNVLSEILICLLGIFTQLQDDDATYENDESLKKLLRFLKHSLKLNENFVKYSDINSNEWIKALDLCKKFAEVKLLYYPVLKTSF